MNTRMNTRIRSIAVTTGVVLFGGIGVASALGGVGGGSDLPSPTTVPVARPMAVESAASTTTTLVNSDGTAATADTSVAPPSGAIGGSIGGDDDHDDDHEEYEDHDEDHDGDRDGDHDDDHDEDGDD